jgi:hypothetical protein
VLVGIAVKSLPELLELLVFPVVQKRLNLPVLQGERAETAAKTICSNIREGERTKLKSSLDAAVSDPANMGKHLGTVCTTVLDVMMKSYPELLELLVLPLAIQRMKIPAAQSGRAQAMAKAISTNTTDHEKTQLRGSLSGVMTDPSDLEKKLKGMWSVLVGIAMKSFPELLEVLVLPVVQQKLNLPVLQGERARLCAVTISGNIKEPEKTDLKTCLESAMSDPSKIDKQVEKVCGVLLGVAMQSVPELLELLVLPMVQKQLDVPVQQGERAKVCAVTISENLGVGEIEKLKECGSAAVKNPAKLELELGKAGCIVLDVVMKSFPELLELLVLPLVLQRLNVPMLQDERAQTVVLMLSRNVLEDEKTKLKDGFMAEELGQVGVVLVDVLMRSLPELLELLVLPIAQKRMNIPVLQDARAQTIAKTIGSNIRDREVKRLRNSFESALSKSKTSDPSNLEEELGRVSCVFVGIAMQSFAELLELLVLPVLQQRQQRLNCTLLQDYQAVALTINSCIRPDEKAQLRKSLERAMLDCSNVEEELGNVMSMSAVSGMFSKR